MTKRDIEKMENLSLTILVIDHNSAIGMIDVSFLYNLLLHYFKNLILEHSQ